MIKIVLNYSDYVKSIRRDICIKKRKAAEIMDFQIHQKTFTLQQDATLYIISTNSYSSQSDIDNRKDVAYFDSLLKRVSSLTCCGKEIDGVKIKEPPTFTMYDSKDLLTEDIEKLKGKYYVMSRDNLKFFDTLEIKTDCEFYKLTQLTTCIHKAWTREFDDPSNTAIYVGCSHSALALYNKEKHKKQEDASKIVYFIKFKHDRKSVEIGVTKKRKGYGELDYIYELKQASSVN